MTARVSCINPITLSIGLCAVLLILLGLRIGATAAEIAQHMFLPYFVDIRRGVGDAGAAVFRAAVLLVQIVLAALVIARCNSKAEKGNLLLSTAGVVLTILYCTLIAAAYVLPRLH